MNLLTPEAFRVATGVSRETMSRLELFANALIKWNRSVNLVSETSLADVWRRHFLDSAQLLALAPPTSQTWIDLGAGAGFPGLVLAIMGAPDVHLIESNQRKCEFLRATARQTATNVTIHCQRIEDMTKLHADVITARAIGPLAKLIDLSRAFATQGTLGLFIKGSKFGTELTALAKYPTIQLELVKSRSHSSGVILRLKGFDNS